MPLVSGAITSHFLFGAATVADLAMLHCRFGVAGVTRAGAVLTAIGLLGWAPAREPWQLFAATVPSGAGWALTSRAALSAMVAPWFVHCRPAALPMAFNGASLGGVIVSPLWIVLIGTLGFAWAAALVATMSIGTVWLLTERYFTPSPAAMGLATACAIGGRSTLGMMLRAEASRRTVTAVNIALQVCGSAALLASAGQSVSLLLLDCTLFGLGFGNATSLSSLIAQAELAPSDVSRMVELVAAISQAGFAFAPAAFGTLHEFGAITQLLLQVDAPLLFITTIVIQVPAAVVVLLDSRSRSYERAPYPIPS